jgi:hypothetical protein
MTDNSIHEAVVDEWIGEHPVDAYRCLACSNDGITPTTAKSYLVEHDGVTLW